MSEMTYKVLVACIENQTKRFTHICSQNLQKIQKITLQKQHRFGWLIFQCYMEQGFQSLTTQYCLASCRAERRGRGKILSAVREKSEAKLFLASLKQWPNNGEITSGTENKK